MSPGDVLRTLEHVANASPAEHDSTSPPDTVGEDHGDDRAAPGVAARQRPRRPSPHVLQGLALRYGLDPDSLVRAAAPSLREQHEATMSHIRASQALTGTVHATRTQSPAATATDPTRTVSANSATEVVQVHQPGRDHVSRRSRIDRSSVARPRRSKRLRTPSANPDLVHTRPARRQRRNTKRLYVVDELVDHGTSDIGPVFLVRWQDCPDSGNTWEPLHHLRRSHVTRYCRRRRLPLPPGLDTCLEG